MKLRKRMWKSGAKHGARHGFIVRRRLIDAAQI
jgi:hypothetical protein